MVVFMNIIKIYTPTLQYSNKNRINDVILQMQLKILYIWNIENLF